MATTYVLKRKTYSSEDGKKEGMSTGAKIALGTGTLAAGFYGARKGMFGARAMAGANKGWARLGKAIGSDNMMLSGAQGYGVARAKQIDKALLNRTNSQMTKQAFNAKANQKGSQFLDSLLKKK